MGWHGPGVPAPPHPQPLLQVGRTPSRWGHRALRTIFYRPAAVDRYVIVHNDIEKEHRERVRRTTMREPRSERRHILEAIVPHQSNGSVSSVGEPRAPSRTELLARLVSSLPLWLGRVVLFTPRRSGMSRLCTRRSLQWPPRPYTTPPLPRRHCGPALGGAWRRSWRASRPPR